MDITVYITIGTIIIYVFAKLLSLVTNRGHKLVKSESKMPASGYKLIYTDQKNIERVEGVMYSTTLKSSELDITGKPDYVFENRKGDILPIEIKSGEIKDRQEPHYSDLMQLVAYFAIVEECFNVHVAEGLIIYSDYMFKVKNTKRLRKELKGVLSDMRSMLKHGEGEPAASFALCRNCVCKGTVCEYYE